MAVSRNRSIRAEIFQSSIFLSFIILIIFGVFLSLILYRSGMAAARDTIKQRNYADTFFIDGYFSQINSTVEILAADYEVRNAPFLSNDSEQRVREQFTAFKGVSSNITYLYSAYEDQQVIIDGYELPQNYNPKQRPWYQAAMNSRPEVFTGLPYQEVKTQEWMLSTSKALRSDKHGYIGVVSADSSIETIYRQLDRHGDTWSSTYSYVLKPHGEIILHSKTQYLGKNFFEVVEDPVSFRKTEGAIEYELDGEERIAYFSHSAEADWIVVTVVYKSEILQTLINRIAVYLLLTGTIAILLGFIQSSLLSRRLTGPLIQLQQKVRALADDQQLCDADEIYPNNEIGAISREVGQLAASKLKARTEDLERANVLLEQKNAELNRLTNVDQLTGLYHRSKVVAELDSACVSALRKKNRLSIILFELDSLKSINNRYGFHAGDTVLVECARLLKSNLRAVDISGRWAGEELIVVCPDLDLHEAKFLATQICEQVASYRFSIRVQMTISAGVAELSPIDDINSLIKRADDQLQSAKETGKNSSISA